MLVKLYLSFFSLSRAIKLAKRISSSLFASITDPMSDIQKFAEVRDWLRGLIRKLANRYLSQALSRPREYRGNRLGRLCQRIVSDLPCISIRNDAEAYIKRISSLIYGHPLPDILVMNGMPLGEATIMVIPKKKRMNEAIGPESPRMFVRNGTIRAHRSSSQSQSTPECPCLARLVGEHVSHRIYEVAVYKREPCRGLREFPCPSPFSLSPSSQLNREYTNHLRPTSQNDLYERQAYSPAAKHNQSKLCLERIDFRLGLLSSLPTYLPSLDRIKSFVVRKGFNPAPSAPGPVYRMQRLEVCPSGVGILKSFLKQRRKEVTLLLSGGNGILKSHKNCSRLEAGLRAARRDHPTQGILRNPLKRNGKTYAISAVGAID
ncbi:hypothetical protein V6N13_026569 [Hibiscus sabdariffa]